MRAYALRVPLVGLFAAANLMGIPPASLEETDAQTSSICGDANFDSEIKASDAPVRSSRRRERARADDQR